MYNVTSPHAEEFISHEEILDTLKYAEENNENLGTATEKLLLLAFQVAESADEAGVSEEDIDSQHTEEEASPLTPKEIKALRKLLKKKK